MTRSRRYEDRQEAVQTFFPADFKEVEASVIVEAWKKKSPDEDLWFVFATCKTASQELRFVYPIGAPLGTAPSHVLRNAQEQHSRFGRPALTTPPEVLLLTQELVERLTLRSRGTGDKELCDFCGVASKERKGYPARDFRLPNGSMSIGGWAACPECVALVDARDEDGLVARMIPRDATCETHDMNFLGELTRQVAREFFANCLTGDPLAKCYRCGAQTAHVLPIKDVPTDIDPSGVVEMPFCDLHFNEFFAREAPKGLAGWIGIGGHHAN